ILIFPVETFLGISAVKHGPLYPPERLPIGFEVPLIKGLAWFYSSHLGEYVHVWSLVTVIAVGGVAAFALRAYRGPLKEVLEEFAKVVKFLGGLLAVLYTISFGNVMDIDTEGLNLFAAHYAAEVEKLGSNQAAIDKLRGQVETLMKLD